MQGVLRQEFFNHQLASLRLRQHGCPSLSKLIRLNARQRIDEGVFLVRDQLKTSGTWSALLKMAAEFIEGFSFECSGRNQA